MYFFELHTAPIWEARPSTRMLAFAAFRLLADRHSLLSWYCLRELLIQAAFRTGSLLRQSAHPQLLGHAVQESGFAVGAAAQRSHLAANAGVILLVC